MSPLFGECKAATACTRVEGRSGQFGAWTVLGSGLRTGSGVQASVDGFRCSGSDRGWKPKAGDAKQPVQQARSNRLQCLLLWSLRVELRGRSMQGGEGSSACDVFELVGPTRTEGDEGLKCIRVGLGHHWGSGRLLVTLPPASRGVGGVRQAPPTFSGTVWTP